MWYWRLDSRSVTLRRTEWSILDESSRKRYQAEFWESSLSHRSPCPNKYVRTSWIGPGLLMLRRYEARIRDKSMFLNFRINFRMDPSLWTRTQVRRYWELSWSKKWRLDKADVCCRPKYKGFRDTMLNHHARAACSIPALDKVFQQAITSIIKEVLRDKIARLAAYSFDVEYLAGGSKLFPEGSPRIA